MKKLLALLLLSALAFGCQAGPEDAPTVIPSTDYAPELDEILKAPRDFSREALLLIPSSVLSDDNEEFSYAAQNALDQDDSTAWCAAEDDEWTTWSVHFNELILPGTVGLMAGFGGDESIYFENNRAKTITLRYDAREVGVLELEDTYTMQFFELPEEPVSQIDFMITEVYPGSKYSDTCLAEVDFWSELPTQ